MSQAGGTVWELPVGDTSVPEEGAEGAENWGDGAGGGAGAAEGGWEELMDDDGNSYWYNSATGESQY